LNEVRAAVLAVLVALAPSAAAAPSEEAGAWEPARTVAAAGPDGLAAALAESPESASALRRLMALAHEAGDAARVRAALGRLADMGYALSPATQAALSVHIAPEEAAPLGARFAANRAALEASQPFASVPAERRLIEGVAFDSRRGRLFASSVVGRELLVLEGGTWRAVAGIDAGSLFGMAVDVRHRRLWIASGALDQTPGRESAFRGLIGLDLDTLRVARRIPVPDGGSPGDVGLGADGTVYASDPVGGAVYRAGPGDAALAVLVPAGRLRSPQGLAVAADGRRLYVADYAYGIGIVDLPSGRTRRLAARLPAMLDGIDGLVLHRGSLIAIQNGTNPMRILRLRLDRDGDTVTGVEVLERASAQWGGEPTLGAVESERLLFVANAQWDRYGPGGARIGEVPTNPTAIRTLPLRGGRR
jgi:hypothetical protein